MPRAPFRPAVPAEVLKGWRGPLAFALSSRPVANGSVEGGAHSQPFGGAIASARLEGRDTGAGATFSYRNASSAGAAFRYRAPESAASEELVARWGRVASYAHGTHSESVPPE